MRSSTRIAIAVLLALAVVPVTASGGLAKPRLIAMTEQVRGMCQRAEQLINSGKFNDAMQVLKQADAIDPTCGEVHGYLGMAYQNSGNPAKAIAEYSKALQLNPQMSFINVNLGTCYMNSNRLGEAVPYFQRYLQENPNAPDAAQVRSYIQQAGSRGNQQNLRGIVEQGQALLNQHRYPEAQAAFQQAVSMQPDFAPAHFYLGFALSSGGQFQPAIAAFQQALRLDPNLKEATMNIASNYQSLGDCPNAIQYYEAYLRQNPGSPKSGDIKQRISGLQRQMSQQPAQPAGQPGQPGQPNTGGAFPDNYFTQVASGGRYYRWQSMPVTVCIAPGAGVAGYQNSYTQQLMDAFSMWSQATGNRLSFTLVQNPAQANILCNWTADPRHVVEAGRAVEGGLTKLSGQPLPNGDVAITNARMTILTNRSGASLSNNDMKKVCLHEVGHALGLSGHSSNNADIMFFSEVPTAWPALSQRDAATIRRLYSR